ncbi:MAG: class I SAM-dependent methyltransferase [Pelagibacteraceae bacterium]
MKKFIKNKLLSFLYFIEVYFKVRIRNKTSPIDIYYENLSLDCYNFFKSDMKKSSIFLKPKDIRKFSVSKAVKNNNKRDNLFLEFGVFRGESINIFSDILIRENLTIYGFDSFEGLEEDWNMNEYNPVGTFSLNKKIPRVKKNVTLIKGKVQETLIQFLEKNSSKKIAFAHLDMDTYTPTKFTLLKIKPFLMKGSVILFDQLYGYPNWEENEFKALKEVFNDNDFKYIAFCESEVAIEIL